MVVTDHNCFLVIYLALFRGYLTTDINENFIVIGLHCCRHHYRRRPNVAALIALVPPLSP